MAGGVLLASGLAFTALFAMVPAALLIIGVAGLVLGNRVEEIDLDALAEWLPEPLTETVATLVDQLARDAAALSLIGLIGVAWGVSRFNAALERALSRVFHEAPRRGIVGRTVFSLLAVVALLAAVVAGIVATAGVSILEEWIRARDGPLVELLPARLISTGIMSLLVAFGVAAVYRYVPTARPSWTATSLPAIAVGLAVTILTQLFVFLAPRLIGAAVVLGSAATIFAALAWFSLVFQALLLGAAWTAERTR